MLVTMEYRQPPRSVGNFHGKDDEDRPHDERAVEAWTLEAREAAARKLMLGCDVSAQELDDARLTMKEASALAVDIERRIESDHKRLTLPPSPAEPQRARVFTQAPVEAELEPAPRKRRKKRDTKLLMRRAIEFRHEERELFND